MTGTTRVTIRRRQGAAVYDLADGTGRFALAVDGVVRYCGSREECERRYAILTAPASDRPAQDRAVADLCVLSPRSRLYANGGARLRAKATTPPQPKGSRAALYVKDAGL